MKNELTKRQRQVYDFIVEFALKHGYLPTIREIGDGVGLSSTSSVAQNMAAIQKKGYISRETGLSGYSVKGLKYTFTEE